MLTKSDALALVERELQRKSPPDTQLVVYETDTIEKAFGWIFFYNTKEFRDTGNFSSRLVGNGPVMVNKYDGNVTFYGTGESLEHYIEDYERKLFGQTGS
jgi:secreted PhoX family phosphatase